VKGNVSSRRHEKRGPETYQRSRHKSDGRRAAGKTTGMETQLIPTASRGSEGGPDGPGREKKRGEPASERKSK